MDRVFIQDLRIDAIIGIFDWERKVRQSVSIDLEMAWDIEKAAKTDDIQYALNYKAVSDRLHDVIGQSEFQLIETMAEKIAALIRHEFSVCWLKLRLSKPGALPGSCNVGLEIERGCINPDKG